MTHARACNTPLACWLPDPSPTFCRSCTTTTSFQCQLLGPFWATDPALLTYVNRLVSIDVWSESHEYVSLCLAKACHPLTPTGPSNKSIRFIAALTRKAQTQPWLHKVWHDNVKEHQTSREVRPPQTSRKLRCS